MTFKPPWSLPTSDGTDVGAPVMQAPPALQLTVSASKEWLDQMGPAASQVGDQIVNFYSSNLSQFVQSQRQQNAIGGIQQTNRQMDLPGLSVEHLRGQDLETIRITVYPESAPAESFTVNVDLNLDGYVAWTLNWSKFPPPQTDNPAVDVVLNGFGVLSNFVRDDDLFQLFPPALDPTAQVVQATMVFVVAFGDTALRCESLQDKSGHNPFTSTNGSGGPLPTIIPSRGSVPGDGTVPAHKDLLGYFVFNWGDPLNPDTFAYDGNADGSGPGFQYKANFPKETIIKIVQFKSTKDSPLVASGKNTLQVQTTNFPPLNPTGQNGVSFLAAEFYNRSVMRPVQQSWKYKVNTAASILMVNDKPLYFACDGGNPYSDIGAKQYFAMTFDLTPSKTPGKESKFGHFAPHEDLFIPPLTAAEQATQNINNAGEAAHALAFNTARLALGAAQLDLENVVSSIVVPFRGAEINLAYDYARNPTPANLAALQAAEPNAEMVRELIIYAQASVAYQLNPLSAKFQAAFVAAEAQSGALALIVVADFLEVVENTEAYQYSLAYGNAHDKALAQGDTEAQAIAAGQAALTSAQTALSSVIDNLADFATAHGRSDLATSVHLKYAALVAAENAFVAVQALFNPSHILADDFQGIEQFNHRIITVSNGVYEIGGWSLG